MKTINFTLSLASKRHSPTEEKVEVKISDYYPVEYLKNLIKPEFRSEFKKILIDGKQYLDEQYIDSSCFTTGKSAFILYLDDEIHIKFKCLNYFTDAALEVIVPTNEKITFQQLIQKLSDQYCFDFNGEIFIEGFDTEVTNKDGAVIWTYPIKNYTTLGLKIKKNYYQSKMDKPYPEEEKKINEDFDQKQEFARMFKFVERDIRPLITRP